MKPVGASVEQGAVTFWTSRVVKVCNGVLVEDVDTTEVMSAVASAKVAQAVVSARSNFLGHLSHEM